MWLSLPQHLTRTLHAQLIGSTSRHRFQKNQKVYRYKRTCFVGSWFVQWQSLCQQQPSSRIARKQERWSVVVGLSRSSSVGIRDSLVRMRQGADYQNSILPYPSRTLQNTYKMGLVHGSGHENPQKLKTRLQNINRYPLIQLIPINLSYFIQTYIKL